MNLDEIKQRLERLEKGLAETQAALRAIAIELALEFHDTSPGRGARCDAIADGFEPSVFHKPEPTPFRKWWAGPDSPGGSKITEAGARAGWNACAKTMDAGMPEPVGSDDRNYAARVRAFVRSLVEPE
jgi:hypothetical protein